MRGMSRQIQSTIEWTKQFLAVLLAMGLAALIIAVVIVAIASIGGR